MIRASNVYLVVALASLGIQPAPPSRADDAKAPGLMQQKLKETQKVLEGIALNDLDKVAKHADELATLSRKAQWKVLKTPLYILYSDEFHRSAERLGRNARDKNLDAAVLTYVELTLTCVKCHKHVREVRMAQLDRN